MSPVRRWWLLGATAPALAVQLPTPWLDTVRAWPQASVLAEALERHVRLDAITLVLLAGDGAARTVPRDEQAFRALLHARGLAHHVLYPISGSHHLALRRLLGIERAPALPEWKLWRCETCADPDCEHRLFQRLMERRSG